MTFGNKQMHQDRLALATGKGGGVHHGEPQGHDDDDDGNPLLVMGGTLAALGFVAFLLFLFIKPPYWTEEPFGTLIGHRKMLDATYDFTPVFDAARAPQALAAAIDSQCALDRLPSDIKAEAVGIGDMLTAYTRATGRLNCVLKLPDEAWCSSANHAYLAGLLLDYERLRGEMRALSQSARNLGDTLAGSQTLLLSQIETNINQTFGEDAGNRSARTPADGILELHRTGYKADFDSGLAARIGALSEEGYIGYWSFPNWGFSLPAGIGNSLHKQIYAPRC